MKKSGCAWRYHDALYHHGVKGMRWGVRRYQNKDGTLTEEGKKRYGTVLDLYQEQTKTYNEKSIKAQKRANTTAKAWWAGLGIKTVGAYVLYEAGAETVGTMLAGPVGGLAMSALTSYYTYNRGKQFITALKGIDAAKKMHQELEKYKKE